MAAMSVLGDGQIFVTIDGHVTWLWVRPCVHAATSVSSSSCYARRCATTGAGAWSMAEPGFIIMFQSTEAFGRISYPGFARAVRT